MASTLQYAPKDETQVGSGDKEQLVDPPPGDDEVDTMNTNNNSDKGQCQS